MRKFIVALVAVMCLGIFSTPSYAFLQKVEQGYVGVKVYLLGSDKGVDNEVLTPGRYWIGWNEELYLFPTFAQTYNWTASKTEGSPDNEELKFQTKEGLEVSGDFGITYTVDPSKVSLLFQKYRKGVDEITALYLRNMVRDALVQVGSNLPVEAVYGEGKVDLIKNVQAIVRQQVEPIGINVERIFMIGSMRLPSEVTNALKLKIAATQQAEQRQNEVAEARASAEKAVAEAEGQARVTLAKAKAEADSILMKAAAQSKANKLLADSLTPELVEMKRIEKWSGAVPTYSGGGAPIPVLNVSK